MTQFYNPTDGISQEALAGLVAEAVQQALVQHGMALDPQALASAGAIAGSAAAALTFLSQPQRLAIDTVRGEWTALATELVQSMADKAARRGKAPNNAATAGADKTTSASAPDKATSSLPGERSLQSMLIEDWAGEVAGSTYLEENFRIPRSTLHRWQRRSEVIALRKGGRKHVFPLAQFVDGRPAAGISEVLSAIANPRLAWFWLNRAAPELGGRVPIEMLKQDMVQDVVSAARDFSPP
ncbi:antitoxin Xre/MbcA/ParS-like domain-containing protein [Mesorhizobium sp. ArgA1]